MDGDPHIYVCVCVFVLCLCSMADSVNSEVPDDAEARVWNVFERVFCFLKGMTIYQTRRRLKFIMVSQTFVCTLRLIPVIFGQSYQTIVPIFILVRNPTTHAHPFVYPI